MEGAGGLDGLSQTACDRNAFVYFPEGEVCVCVSERETERERHRLCGYRLKENTCGERETRGAPKDGPKISKLKRYRMKERAS